tara:strand:- start:213 stop:536 length:324 start_codon:yes stop_codon:yes gene_type:complete
VVVEGINYRSTTEIVVEKVCRKAGTRRRKMLVVVLLKDQAAEVGTRSGEVDTDGGVVSGLSELKVSSRHHGLADEGIDAVAICCRSVLRGGRGKAMVRTCLSCCFKS